MSYKNVILYAILFSCFFFVSCGDEVYIPKPRGYFRMELHDTTYTQLKGDYPYFFEHSNQAFIDPLENKGKYWANLIYPDLNAILFITYKDIKNENLNDLINDSRTFVYKQFAKADDVLESHIIDSSINLYGKIYETVGDEAPCPFQFWVTDKQDHFLRASLYLNNVPQNDSLAPIINYLKKDMLYLIQTFKWEKSEKQGKQGKSGKQGK